MVATACCSVVVSTAVKQTSTSCYDGSGDSILLLSWVLRPQAAQVVLISLFELNTPEFTMLLGALPKTFQDGATKLLHSHLKSCSHTGGSSAVSQAPLLLSGNHSNNPHNR